MLARETDLDGVLSAMRGIENRFNKDYHYPWVFLSEVEFSEAFKAYVPSASLLYAESRTGSPRNVTEAASSSVSFGLIPPEHWYMPDWINKEKVETEMAQLATVPHIPYASTSPACFRVPEPNLRAREHTVRPINFFVTGPMYRAIIGP
jgi:hypothetical protein